MSENIHSPEASFHPAVERWFSHAMGSPTLPQAMGWPEIQAGRSCLILAPTGSGKTLAAFLAGINELVQEMARGGKPRGVAILYISPLKALNYDIERNLREPLAGVLRHAREMGLELPEISVGVRTGDTSSKERARMARRPPHILITTPESLNLILTSRAASMLKNVRQVIVDEIHSLAPNKRGAFLSVLLERLEELTSKSPLRIGLSATQRPLELVARFLGGYDRAGQPRPVSIVDAGTRKGLSITVESALSDFTRQEAGTLWPSVEAKLLQDIRSHRSTIVFAPNRRIIERLTLNLNEQAGEPLAEPHHGSIAPTRRKLTEERLKAGDLKAVVATSTLEMGIDMGAVDLVCQVGSPKRVSSGLQRVGRAGHLNHATSKGRIIATSGPDLLEAALVGREMLAGRVEPIALVENPLDVLAQQIAAMTAPGPIKARRILESVRRSACFHRLPEEAFWRTVEMAAGRLGKAFPARVHLDRVNQELHPLPGTLRSVVSSGGVIPDTGAFPVYLEGTRYSVGELDEEFVYEAREGEAFRLGTSLWRIETIEADRIFVSPTSGVPAKVPFWRGEIVTRDMETGKALGDFLEHAERFQDEEALLGWLRDELPVDEAAARNLAILINSQKEKGTLPTSRRMVEEHFQDALGEGRLAVITPYGAKVHQALRIALVEYFREEHGMAPESMANDEGALVRLPGDLATAGSVLAQISPERFRSLLEQGLTRSPLFGLKFRQNAGRALLMNGLAPGKRSPLWLQRLKAKDLLQAARTVPDFPLVAETARELLQDYLAADQTAALLGQIQSGEMEVSVKSGGGPSPFAAQMEFLFNAEFMYVWDTPVGGDLPSGLKGGIGLASLLASGEAGIDTAAIDRLYRDAANMLERHPARSAAELAEIIRARGGLTTAEAGQAGGLALLDELLQRGSVEAVESPVGRLWVEAGEAGSYRAAMEDPTGHTEFWKARALEFVSSLPGCHPREFSARYGLPEAVGTEVFQMLSKEGTTVEVAGRWMQPGMLEAARRITLSIRREESQPVDQYTYQEFLLDWQRPADELTGAAAVVETVELLAGYFAPGEIWESEIFSGRIPEYQGGWLDMALSGGQVLWQGKAGNSGQLAFWPRQLAGLLPVETGSAGTLSEMEQKVLEVMEARGACFLVDIGLALREDTREIEKALVQLAWKGLATQDSFDIVRKKRKHESVSEAAARTRGSQQSRYRQLKHLRPSLNPAGMGRWSLAPETAAADEESVELAARALLERYGVLCRDIVQASGMGCSWGALYRQLERMELSGEIERGWFVRDFGGAQFALAEVAGRLRRWRSKRESTVLVNSCDPALVLAGQWAKRATTWIALTRGHPTLLVESSARRLTPLDDDLAGLQAASSLIQLTRQDTGARRIRRLQVDFWGNSPVSGSTVEEELRRMGYHRTPSGLVLE